MIAVVYGILLGFLYKSITLKELPSVIRQTLDVTVGVLFIIASATLFSWIIHFTDTPDRGGIPDESDG